MRPAPEIKGWCPDAWRPMASGDGFLLRPTLAGGRLTLVQARDLAQIAQDLGNGLIDLTQRAQLQLRGLQEQTLVTAQRRLLKAGLAPESAQPRSSINTLVSPWPDGAFDAEGLAWRLTKAALAEPALGALPDKFLFLIDAGGALGLADIAADIRLEAAAGGVALVLAGADDRAAIVAPDAAVAAAIALARAFADLRTRSPFAWRRMRAIVAQLGAKAIFEQARLAPTPYASACSPTRPGGWLGAKQQGGATYCGVAAPFGRVRAADLMRFIESLTTLGVANLCLTPWRGLIALAPTLSVARSIETAAGKLGFIVDADDPRLAIVACPGAPECPQARGGTRAIALALAPIGRALAPHGEPAIHVSGCAKGCARPDAAPLTLVCNGAGFDAIRNGCAADSPIATGLDAAAIAQLIEEIGEPCSAR